MIYEVMETKEGMSSDFTVKGDEAPQNYMTAPRNENSNPNPNPNPNLNPNPNPPNSSPNPNPNSIPNQNPNPNSNPNPNQVGGPVVTAGPSPGSLGSGVKKKRGRPRKYAPDGSLATALSPMPISASIPLTAGGTGEVTSWKRGRGRLVEAVKKQVYNNYQYDNTHTTGDRIAYFVGQNFMPHVLTVNAGEDVTMKIMSFSQQGARAICILSANGTISNVTLRQPTTSGGTLTYEGRFEILSLSGSYMPTENGGTKSRSGGMSVSLAGPDGRVVGGGLAGLLIAAGPVQVVVGSFLPGHQQEHIKHKKQRTELPPPLIPATVNIYSPEGTYGGIKPVLVSSASFQGDNSASVNPMQSYKDPSADNRVSSPEDNSRGPDNSNYEVSC